MQINPEDLRIFTYGVSPSRYVLKEETGIHIIHLPTGTEAKCNQTESPHKNRVLAMEQLRAKLGLIKASSKIEKAFLAVHEQALNEGIEHDPDCPYAGTSIPINETTCHCFEKWWFKKGVEAGDKT